MVTDAEAFAITRQLVSDEGILAGGSCGMALAGAIRAAEKYPSELVVAILPDGGRNYLSRIFNDEWMAEQGLLEGT